MCCTPKRDLRQAFLGMTMDTHAFVATAMLGIHVLCLLRVCSRYLAFLQAAVSFIDVVCVNCEIKCSIFGLWVIGVSDLTFFF